MLINSPKISDITKRDIFQLYFVQRMRKHDKSTAGQTSANFFVTV